MHEYSKTPTLNQCRHSWGTAIAIAIPLAFGLFSRAANKKIERIRSEQN